MIIKFIITEDLKHGPLYHKGQVFEYTHTDSGNDLWFHEPKSTGYKYRYISEDICLSIRNLDRYIKENKIIVLDYD
jgi:hypothetical protein